MLQIISYVYLPFAKYLIAPSVLIYGGYKYINSSFGKNDHLQLSAALVAGYACVNPTVITSALESLDTATFGLMKTIFGKAFDYIIKQKTNNIPNAPIQSAKSWFTINKIIELAGLGLINKITTGVNKRLEVLENPSIDDPEKVVNLYKYTNIDIKESNRQKQSAELYKFEKFFLGRQSIDLKRILVQPFLTKVVAPIIILIKGKENGLDLVDSLSKRVDNPALTPLLQPKILPTLTLLNSIGGINYLFIKPFEYIGTKAYQYGYVATGGVIFHYFSYANTAISVAMISLNIIVGITAIVTNYRTTHSFKYWETTKYEDALRQIEVNKSELISRINIIRENQVYNTAKISISYKKSFELVTDSKSPIQALMFEYAKFNNKESEEYMYALAIKLLASDEFAKIPMRDKKRNSIFIMSMIVLSSQEFEEFLKYLISVDKEPPKDSTLVSKINKIGGIFDKITAFSDIGNTKISSSKREKQIINQLNDIDDDLKDKIKYIVITHQQIEINKNKFNTKIDILKLTHNSNDAIIPPSCKKSFELMIHNPLFKEMMLNFAQINNKVTDEYTYALAIKLLTSNEFNKIPVQDKKDNLIIIMLTLTLPSDEFSKRLEEILKSDERMSDDATINRHIDRISHTYDQLNKTVEYSHDLEISSHQKEEYVINNIKIISENLKEKIRDMLRKVTPEKKIPSTPSTASSSPQRA